MSLDPDRIVKLLDLTIQTILSIIKIGLFSKPIKNKRIDYKNSEQLLILANGPSLNTTIQNSSDFVHEKTLLAVNFFVSSPSFVNLKPQLYVIADPFFWTNPTQMNKFFTELNAKTSWDLLLFVPSQAFKVNEWEEIIKENNNIKLQKYNSTPIEGGQWFCNLVFKMGFGVPRPHNVLIPSLIIGLNQPFKTIYIAGADHSWLTEISVNDDNQLLMNQKHFYDQDQTKAATVKRRDFSVARIHNTLYHMYVAFKSYFVILHYANYLDKKIINVTPGSFIDAFERKNL
ncbi:MAG: hypothetical protein ACOYOT_01630 [Bacteroidales bacterium]